MFHFKLEPEIGLLTATRTGFWSLETVAAYEVILRRELSKLQATGAVTSFIIDIRSSSAPTKPVANELRAVVDRLGPLHADRTAVVTSSGIAKLQARCASDRSRQVFTSMILARDWVMDREGQAPSGDVVFDEPSDAAANGQAVRVQGPSDVDINLTPKAALETARRIGDAAIEALINDRSVAVPLVALPT